MEEQTNERQVKTNNNLNYAALQNISKYIYFKSSVCGNNRSFNWIQNLILKLF